MGFTLIELAIVLVIIGVIIGVVLKGQDLIEGSRHKKLAAETKQWEVATWTYLDRKKRFPGDGGEDGTIYSPDSESVKTDFDASGLATAPSTNSITLGSASFYLYLGNAGTKKNVIFVCNNYACEAYNNEDDLEYAKAIDTSLDGTEGSNSGLVRGTTANVSADSTKWAAAVTPDDPSSWDSSITALLYYFDRKP